MISVIIPTQGRRDLTTTLKTLEPQIDHEVIIVNDEGNGANWARNQGAKRANGEYLFFCDDDIELEPWALEKLLETLIRKDAAYSYGWFYLDGETHGDRNFCPEMLKTVNYISTMSLVRKDKFFEVGGFDESVKRFQDWDLWLTMLEHGYHGAYCGMRIFKTYSDPDGISSEDRYSYQDALPVIEKKHKIGRCNENCGLHTN